MIFQTVQTCQMNSNARTVHSIACIVAEVKRVFQNRHDAMANSIAPMGSMNAIAVSSSPIFLIFLQFIHSKQQINYCLSYVAVSIAPLLSELTDPRPLTPQQIRFNSEGFAIFSEKGESGKLCAEGLDTSNEKDIQKTVAESLCKALGYE